MSMDPADWDDLAQEVIERFKPRIDPKWLGGIDAELAGGEYAMAVENLTGILAKDRVPVTERERDDLRALLADIHDPAVDVERLVVELE